MSRLLHFSPYYWDPEPSAPKSAFVLQQPWLSVRIPRLGPSRNWKEFHGCFALRRKGSFIEHWDALCSAREQQTSEALLAFIWRDPTRRDRKATMEWQKYKQKSRFSVINFSTQSVKLYREWRMRALNPRDCCFMLRLFGCSIRAVNIPHLGS